MTRSDVTEDKDYSPSRTTCAVASDSHFTTYNNDVANLNSSKSSNDHHDAHDDMERHNKACSVRMITVQEKNEGGDGKDETYSNSPKNSPLSPKSSTSDTRSVASLSSLWLESIADHDCAYQTFVHPDVESLRLELLLSDDDHDDHVEDSRDPEHDPTGWCLTSSSRYYRSEPDTHYYHQDSETVNYQHEPETDYYQFEQETEWRSVQVGELPVS